METITLFAPLSGRLMPLEAIPDPVLARRMAGEGIALDPVTNALLAPCDGQITAMHPGHHALTITNNNIEITIHVGLGTAELKGEGFLAHAAEGDHVITGQTLLEFDPEYIAAHAASLLTVILISNPERVEEIYKSAGDVQAGRDVLMELVPIDFAALAAKGIYKPIISEPVTVPNHSGLHFRPAAVLASLCRGFKSAICLQKENEEANAKSVSEIMGLNVSYHETVRLSASGPDAYEAINILIPAIINGLGEEGSTPIQAPASIILPAIASRAPRPQSEDPLTIRGIPASPGLATGYVYHLQLTASEIVESASDPLLERARLEQALAHTKLHLESLRARTLAESNPNRAALLAAQHELLDDSRLLEMAFDDIERCKSAEFAWSAAANTQAELLESLGSDLLKSRAADLRQIGRRVAYQITGMSNQDPFLPPGAIVIAEDITSAGLANLDRQKIQGLATVLGGPVSETTALARSLALPLVVGIEARALELANGTSVILDGNQGILRLDPIAEEMAAATEEIQALVELRQQQLATAFQAAQSEDGVYLEIQAAITDPDQAQSAMQKGADGICLATSDFLFQNRRTAPTEDEQTIAYAGVAGTLAPGKTLTICTLNDAGQGGLPYLLQSADPNPALGLRGLRLTLDNPQLLRKQARAILSAAAETERALQILLPMVTTLDEWRVAKELIRIEQERMELEPVPVGLLIQLPAVAMSVAKFAQEASFIVLDADDLAQFSLGMDHRHPRLAAQFDPLEPGVLALIDGAAQAAAAQGLPFAVSGMIAADPQAVPLLLGLGVTGLNVPPASIPPVKAQIAALNRRECQSLLQEALAQETAAQVRALVSASGLGSISKIQTRISG